MIKTDYLVIGSGIGGLSFALQAVKADKDARVAIVTKSDMLNSATRHAQGGVAVVSNRLNDSFESHIEDTLRAGAGHCDQDIVRLVVMEAPDRLAELQQWGIRFDRNKHGNLALGLEGGHSANRIVHHKDQTGLEIARKLINQVIAHPNISVFTNYIAFDLQLAMGYNGYRNCTGVFAMNRQTGQITAFNAKVTVLATGGAGQVYQHTTNPAIATGDGIAIAKRAGCTLTDMEFVQFHPTAYYEPGKRPMFLISEAVRGFGAVLRNINGERFMQRYDDRMELASRDIVSRAIHSEMQQTGFPHVFLDCTHLDENAFKKKFEAITNYLRDRGINPAVDLIPVVPAAHYLCGGISVDSWARTSVNHLLAIGECARTGLHGANRLASNSLLEALVFAKRAADIAKKMASDIPFLGFTNSQPKPATVNVIGPELFYWRESIQEIMSHCAGIKRNDEELVEAEIQLQEIAREIEKLYKTALPSPELVELRNMITVSLAIVQQSQIRKDSMGAFFKESALIEV